RRYPAARAAFEAYLRAHPSGEKAPDALLKIGLCHQRMGDGMAARRAYERLRREHPQSVAARLASREDA
ncbi:MAG: tol-pal system protein, partial [Myxococcales bacterium]|nr:tol-pal system protein [Myxococcales bacterium]